ncbi:MAG TPA: mechanosensitive ion channel family protein [Candidatus Limnocylindrales bacterium]|nr:mechanosensitive ion channel family protein [Candidatus Limnocylindrales bacterium]
MQPNFENLLREWHGDLVEFVRRDAPKLIVVLLLAFILIRLLGVITRKLVELSRKAAQRGVRAQQVATVVGVIHSAGVFAIVFVAAVQVLPIFGINIAPLLASAGIAGLAIGFGAQTLVKDVINGFFILAENQFEVGDVIRAAGVSGKVEEITMRRTILRDGDGTVHIVPNSAIQIVSNTTRDWSQVMLHVAVDYSENSDRVVQLLKEVAEAFYNDEQWRAEVVAQPEVHGIERVRGHEVDYLMTVKVRPGKQYGVSREMRRRIKACFEQNKIKAGAPAQVFFGQLPGAG